MGEPDAAAQTATLRDFALALPGAWEDHPWGDRVVKVGKKIFVFLGNETPSEERADQVGLCVKLPESADEALSLPGTEPAGYGLGKAGWVNMWFAPEHEVPVDLMCDWIEESYRAVAPKKLIKQLEAERAG
ncbi:MAG TPA: MmcQ/YjbR family DNA-binding protein [Acidimicrobiales bacterium]|jgi:predicted DNA-binding protein (MmcQ/YjbR family)